MFAFLLGAAAGGIAVLLLAPDSGKRTRRRVARTGEDLYERGRDVAGRARESTEEQVRKAGREVRSRIDAGMKAVSHGRDALRGN